MEGIIFGSKFLFDIIVEVKGKGVNLGLGFPKCHRQMGSFKPSFSSSSKRRNSQSGLKQTLKS